MAEVSETNNVEGASVKKTVETVVTEDGTTVTTETEEITVVTTVNGVHNKEPSPDVCDEKEDEKTEITDSGKENGEVNTSKTENTDEEKPSSEVLPQAADVVVEEAPKTSENEAVVSDGDIKKDTPSKVILHQYPPGKNVPSMSLFCLKLETFLRLNKIPYENHYGYKVGKNGKVPWIEYDGERRSDSNLIIEFLNEKFGVNIDSNLPADQQAVNRAVKVMIEENTYWALNYSNMIDNFNEFKKFIGPSSGGGIGFSVSMKMMQRKVRSQLDGHGLGRHSREEIYDIANKDIAAVSQLLGEKNFIAGEEPTSLDCTLFGFFANVIWCGVSSPLNDYIKENAKNIIPYCERIKELYWKDWVEMVLGEKPQPVLKKGFSFRKKKAKAAKPAQDPETENAEDAEASPEAEDSKKGEEEKQVNVDAKDDEKQEDAKTNEETPAQEEEKEVKEEQKPQED